MPPPHWALLERELLRANTAACEEFFSRYFDVRGYLLCVERWGGDDGPDDAIESLNDWPLLYALGAPQRILALIEKAWEGHLRQYTAAKTTHVPFARDGMYYREFPVMMDWLHNGEGLTVFNVLGLCDPYDEAFQKRVRRFAGFYLGEDPQAPNYDAEHKLIRSLLNGSRGPLLRPATAVDWAGDPIEVEGRFRLGHGERSYEEMLAHFEDYNDVVGDHPSNLSATTLALNAFMLTGEEKYRRWLLEYVGAWAERTAKNGGIIPTKIGLDGAIGGESGKWYGGVYGWGFTVVEPQSGRLVHRNTHHLGLLGFLNAHLLTGDDRHLDVWRQMIDRINSHSKEVDGVPQYPTMYGDEGWYAYSPAPYSHGAFEIWYATMRPEDYTRVAGRREPNPRSRAYAGPSPGWLGFLGGGDPDYPVRSLEREFGRIAERVRGMRADETTPDTRLSDDPMRFNPASVEALIELMLGGYHPGHTGAVLHARLRYFDPLARRAGIPEDVAALVTGLSERETRLVLVNLHATEAREVIVQTGAYGEHQCESVEAGGRTVAVGAPWFRVRLRPLSGGELVVRARRYANPPTLDFPWARRAAGGVER